MSYKGAYDRKQRISVMLSFNDALWDDEAYHEAQRLSNPHWRRKKEVYSSFQPTLAPQEGGIQFFSTCSRLRALYQRLCGMPQTK